jgi:hypothetical protein
VVVTDAPGAVPETDDVPWPELVGGFTVVVTDPPAGVDGGFTVVLSVPVGGVGPGSTGTGFGCTPPLPSRGGGEFGGSG